ncbi:MAG: hypothetical protein ACK47B_10805 [Armatimonadota bacterium]
MSEFDPLNLDLWQELCEFLASRPRKCAYARFIPNHLSPLVSADAKSARAQVGLIFWSTGWGWRLRKNWQERLDTLRRDGIPAEGGTR